jgi:hypothetical protein
MSVAHAADRLAQLLETTPQQLATITDGDAAHRAGPDRWAAKEILGHLIDSASHNHQRFVRGQLFAAVDLPNYEQESWVKTQNFVAEPWPDLINLWLLFNRHLLHLMRTAPEASLKTPMSIGGDAPVPLSVVITGYVSHLEHHVEQILALK